MKFPPFPFSHRESAAVQPVRGVPHPSVPQLPAASAVLSASQYSKATRPHSVCRALSTYHVPDSYRYPPESQTSLHPHESGLRKHFVHHRCDLLQLIAVFIFHLLCFETVNLLLFINLPPAAVCSRICLAADVGSCNHL